MTHQPAMMSTCRKLVGLFSCLLEHSSKTFLKNIQIPQDCLTPCRRSVGQLTTLHSFNGHTAVIHVFDVWPRVISDFWLLGGAVDSLGSSPITWHNHLKFAAGTNWSKWATILYHPLPFFTILYHSLPFFPILYHSLSDACKHFPHLPPKKNTLTEITISSPQTCDCRASSEDHQWVAEKRGSWASCFAISRLGLDREDDCDTASILPLPGADGEIWSEHLRTIYANAEKNTSTRARITGSKTSTEAGSHSNLVNIAGVTKIYSVQLPIDQCQHIASYFYW